MKIFYTGERYIDKIISSDNNFLAFDIEKDFWIYVDSIAEADIVAVHGNTDNEEYLENQYQTLLNLGYTNQLLIFLDLFHMDETMWHWGYKKIKDFYISKGITNFVYVHNDSNFFDESTIFNDHMFNRQKSYFTEYDKFDKDGKVWTYKVTKKCYELAEIKHNTDSPYLYLCPNRIYPYKQVRNKYRKTLKHILDSSYAKGYVSDPTNGVILEPEETGLIDYMKGKDFGGGGTWYPIANKIYQDTYISIYVETIAGNKDDVSLVPQTFKGLTEKTFDPLIKGHFILPFGYSGMIEDIKRYGFKLPNFIDYSYDNIVNNDARFDEFAKCVKAILDIPLHVWAEYYIQNQDLLSHNRQLFYAKPYDSLYNAINSFVQEKHNGRSSTRF